MLSSAKVEGQARAALSSDTVHHNIMCKGYLTRYRKTNKGTVRYLSPSFLFRRQRLAKVQTFPPRLQQMGEAT